MKLTFLSRVFAHGEARRARAILRQTCSKQLHARKLLDDLQREVDHDLRRCQEIEGRQFKEEFEQRGLIRSGFFPNCNPYARSGNTEEIRDMDRPRVEIAEPSLILLA
jgi:hypothetical protein